ncbi:MAG: 1-acylglycerol-3-phosphate O-acyltransferase [Bacteroidetes bacterium]|nr:1-acylglycerol-3-phosphate O-acyltransferase [Bacteroidota bacterium]
MSNRMKGEKSRVDSFLQVMASCYFWISLFLVSGLLFIIPVFLWISTVLFDRRRRLLHQFTCRWSDIILGINPYWKVRVEGRNKIDPAKVYVMVSNHQSGLDILVLFKLHTHFKWVAKKGLFLIPFIGWNMALNGYIPIERGRGRSKLQMMDKAAESIQAGNSVILFPEGTRSPDGNLQVYKTGAFRLAMETKSPILPVVIKGTHRAIRKGGLLIHKSDQIRLVILDPIPYESFCHMDTKELTLLVHEKTRQELMRQSAILAD